jgi:hypothetical protein
MKRMMTVVLVAMMTVVVLSGCQTLRPNNRPAEIGQKEYAEAGYRSGAPVTLINERSCTNVDWYLYSGQRNMEELLLNVNGKHYVLKGYADHGWLMNVTNPQFPTITTKLLDVNKCYTLLRVVHWGIAGDFSIDAYAFCTSTNAVQSSYRTRLGKMYYANQIITMPGSDTPAMQRLDLNFTFHPNAAVNGFINGLFGR